MISREGILSRISIDPNICFGKPCIRGHRIWVSLVLDFLASGWTVAEILANYPGIEEEDVRACLVYAGADVQLRSSSPRRVHNSEMTLKPQSPLEPYHVL